VTGTVVVIPVRGLNDGKSRLASHLAPEERAALVGGMASHVIGAVLASGVADAILVVSREADLLRNLRTQGADIDLLHQPAHVTGLNAAIELGRHAALERDVECLVVLSADLPVLTARAVADLVAIEVAAGVVLGTDRAGLGTNALVLRGANATTRFAFQFGPDSRRLHRQEASRIGARYAETLAPGIALDLDTPDDWAMLSEEVRRHLLGSRPASPLYPAGAVGIGAMAILE